MLKISQQITIKLIVAINTLANLHFFISRPCLSPSPRLSTPATFPGALPRAKERRTVGNGATKKPQHSLQLFLVHHRGLSRVLKTPHWGVFARRTGGGPEPFSSPDGAPD